MKSEGFAPHVHRHPGNKGDEKVTKRYEAFQKHETVLKRHADAVDALADAKSRIGSLECDVNNTARDLQSAREVLDALITPKDWKPPED